MLNSGWPEADRTRFRSTGNDTCRADCRHGTVLLRDLWEITLSQPTPAKGINTSGKCLTTVLNPVVHVRNLLSDLTPYKNYYC